jgi:hypothetical protein
MQPQLITENIWQSITAACTTTQRSYVAVAYFGTGGAGRLPLNKGSVLVVDASEAAVKAGQTSPAELIKLYKRGVSVYSLQGLHAKVYVIGTRLYIGSANVSENAADNLKEAVFNTADRKLVAQAKEYVLKMKEQAGLELGIAQLQRLEKLYKERKMPAGGKGSKKDNRDKPSVFLYKLHYNDYPAESLAAYKEGKEIAIQEIDRSRHVLDDFESESTIPVKKNDIVIQVMEDGRRSVVYYPARVLYIKKWKHNRCFVYLERLKKRSKPLSKVKQSIDKTVFERSGRKAAALEKEFITLWK